MDGFFLSVWEFIRGNLPTVIGWIVAIGVTALLNPYISQRLRRASESRDAHLAELKKDLLEPMLRYIHEHVLPILEHRRGNVGVSRKLVTNPSAGVMASPTDYTETFCLRESGQAPIDPALDAPDGEAEWDLSKRPLYLDGQHHFRKLFSEWDALMNELTDYHVSCIGYASELRSEIAKASSLPEFSLARGLQRWVSSTNLALVIFYRQFGLERHAFARSPEGQDERLTYKGSYTLAQGPTEELAKVILGLDQLARRRDTLDSLKADAERIKRRALNVMAELERLLLMRKLPGRCKYLA